MMRYLAMDIRRLFKTRGFYVTILISLVLLGIFAGASYFVTGIGEEMLPEGHAGQMPFGGEAMLQQARRMMNFSFFVSFYLSSNSILHLLLAVMAAGFISKDHQTGYLKNLFCIRGLREKWLISKLLTMLLAAVVFYGVFSLASALVVVIYGNPVQIDWAATLSYLGLHLTVDLALFAVICLVTALWQTKTAAVVIAMLVSFNLQSIIYLLVDQFGLFEFKLREWGMMSQANGLRLAGGLTSFVQEGTGTQAGELLPVSLGLMLGASLLCWLTLRKRDYKG